MNDSMRVNITECPRDAMQGIKAWIPTKEKIKYLNQLLKVGFDRLDAGSFVSPKAIPQLSDSAEVFDNLDLNGSSTEILAIIANSRGADMASQFKMVRYLGYPFSVSETFQKRNTNATISESLVRLSEIQKICIQRGKILQVYLSMAFGNPYAEPWSPEIVIHWAKKMQDMGIQHIALADTTGVSDLKTIEDLFTALIPEMPEITFSAHLHAIPQEVALKAQKAWDAGCRHFDTALKGYGGCPMAEDELIGNMDTEILLNGLSAKGATHQLNQAELLKASEIAQELFTKYH